MKIRPVGAELFHADGRTDMTNLIITFRNFASAPKNRKRCETTTSPNLFVTTACATKDCGKPLTV